MSFSKQARALVLAGLTLGGVSVLGACSFSPVYGDAAAAQSALNFAYGSPNTRLEQIVYQDLALRLGRSDSPTATLATVSVSTGGGRTMRSETADPSEPFAVTATVTLTLTRRDGTVAQPVSITRRATASYGRNDQVLADRTAEDEASERATRAATESLRLAVLANLSR